ncbi:SnoaL-like domain-containing protein [Gordonia sp. TBRC 11910]|uniref:SnoaL-like domain-containing protein n=1 Tax=Gordonia asplenii TaxID=2725283 RepID=A0A848L3N2_9ACTN|nr:nuclear transport factor 2 family protein [Gordonia asplenii]NMO03665.1 SnoaL-like domain-containing protein [Gordonia asplenii]
MTGSTDAIIAVSQVVLRERQARDRGWWDQMRDCIHPAAQIRLSWFRGTGADFIVESREMSRRGQRATHRLGPPVVSVREDRAVVDISAAIEFRDALDGIEVDVTSYTRLLYRLERRCGSWQIQSLDPIYERDTLLATTAGADAALDHAVLSSYRPSYRFLAYYLNASGYEISDDLYGDDRPEQVDALYRFSFAWMEHDPDRS